MSAARSTEWMLACVGCTDGQLRYWNELGLVGPARSGSGIPLTWRTMDALRAMIIYELRGLGVSLESCAMAIAAMAPGPLSDKTLCISRTGDGPHDMRVSIDYLTELPDAGVIVAMNPLIDRLRTHWTTDTDTQIPQEGAHQ